MIVHIEGRLVEAAPLSAIIDVHGLGYQVHVPVTTAERLPRTGDTVHLFTHAVYREDSQTLYGFTSRAERDFFRLLTEKVSGIGPKIGLSIMSKLSLPMLRSAIAQADVGLLAKCPGIGKKTAERLCIELRDKVMPEGGGGSSTVAPEGGAQSAVDLPSGRIQDAVMALVALGYKPDVADKAIRRAESELGADARTEALIKAALK